MALDIREKLAKARTECYRRKDLERKREDMKDPIYREAYNEAQRMRRAKKNGAA